MIAIIDYEMGNLRSVQKGFLKVGHDAIITDDPKTVKNASKIVLPGVGAFCDCMRNLQKRGLDEAVIDSINCGKAFLGICLGFQLLFTESEEFGIHKGLDVLKGRVKKFSNLPYGYKIPHMGWNSITVLKETPLFKNIKNETSFYFVHSYYVKPANDTIVAATTDYGPNFCSGISINNINGVQFHPEKSQEHGLLILKNFGDLCL